MKRLALIAAAALTLAGCERPQPPAPTPPAAQKHAPAPVERHTETRPAATPTVPVLAREYAPVLAVKQRASWPTAPEPWTLGGLIEQESCASLTSKACWNPHAELKTSREYGFGLGQITIAYRADGSERFNKFNELRGEYKSLSGWQWADRYEPGHQLTAIVEMTHTLWRRMPPAADDREHWAFALSSYNGGAGGLMQDRHLCIESSGCDATRWFDNIETHSVKSRAPLGPGYGGQSAFSVNRGYVRNVLNVRREKYRQFWEAA